MNQLVGASPGVVGRASREVSADLASQARYVPRGLAETQGRPTVKDVSSEAFVRFLARSSQIRSFPLCGRARAVRKHYEPHFTASVRSDTREDIRRSRPTHTNVGDRIGSRSELVR